MKPPADFPKDDDSWQWCAGVRGCPNARRLDNELVPGLCGSLQIFEKEIRPCVNAKDLVQQGSRKGRGKGHGEQLQATSRHSSRSLDMSALGASFQSTTGCVRLLPRASFHCLDASLVAPFFELPTDIMYLSGSFMHIGPSDITPSRPVLRPWSWTKTGMVAPSQTLT